jgi:nucleoid-associated protein
VDKKAETESFLQSVSNFSMDIPDSSVNEFQSQVVDFCIDQDKQGEPVEFAALSESVAADVAGIDAHKLAAALGKDQKKLHVDRNSMRKFLRFTGREKDLTVSFNSSQIPDRIEYDKQHDILSIKGLPKALREQLLAHLES